MTYFGPSRGEMKFRLTISLTGLILVVIAVAMRGLPGEAVNAQLGALAVVFLIGSAWNSARGMQRMKDE